MIAPRLLRAQEATDQPFEGLTSSGWENLLGYRLEDANAASFQD
jgi:hypothetical protein